MSFLRIPRNTVGTILVLQFIVLAVVIGIFAMNIWTRFEIVPCVPVV